MIDVLGSTDLVRGSHDAIRRAVEGVAAYIVTGRHEHQQLLAAYEPVTVWVGGEKRKIWGRAMRLALEAWDDSAGVGELVGVLRLLIDALLALGKVFQDRGGKGLVYVVASLAHLTVALRAAERRLRELQASQPEAMPTTETATKV